MSMSRALRTVVLVMGFALIAGTCEVISQGPAAAGAATTTSTYPLPSADPFYTAPANLSSLAPGTPIRSRVVPAKINNFGTNIPLTATQLAYASTDNHGQPIITVTTLLVPQAKWTGSGSRPVIVYLSAEDSTGSQCEPSYTLATNDGLLTGQEADDMAQALNQGITLAVPDYEGPNSAYLLGLQSAHIALDSVRAVRQFTAGGYTANTVFGLWGYSGGGHAAAWTAEINSSYAPDVHFAGASIGGPIVNLVNSTRQLNGGPFVGFALGAMVGIAHGTPNWDIQSQLNAKGKQVWAQVDQKCIADFVVNVAFTNINSMSVSSNPLSLPQNLAVMNADNIGQAKPIEPVFFYYSTIDEAVPTADSQGLIAKYCSMGVPMSIDQVWYAEHSLLGSLDAGKAVNYLADRFNGKKLTSSC